MRATLLIFLFLIALDFVFIQSAYAERDNHGGLTFGGQSSSENSVAVESYSQGGVSNSTTGGVSQTGASNNDDSSFFAFATTFPQAHGCMGGVQGGGAGSSSGGFFGIHFINENCWTSALAEAEANIEVKALLKCHGHVFRDAIAFEQTRNKQRYCVDFMLTKYAAQIQAARNSVETALERGELEATTEPIVVAGNVTEEQFETVTDDQQAQIDELERRTVAAEKRAAKAEAQLRTINTVKSTKRKKLLELQQQLRSENAE